MKTIWVLRETGPNREVSNDQRIPTDGSSANAPLLPDIFWRSMAITIMFGLIVGSMLTIVFVPVLYSIFYNVKESAIAPTGAEVAAA